MELSFEAEAYRIFLEDYVMRVCSSKHLWPGSFFQHLSWWPRSLWSSPLSYSVSLCFLSFLFFTPFTTHSPIMIHDLELLTSPPTPSPLLLFLYFLQCLAGTESRRSGERHEEVAVAGWMEDRWSPARGRLRGQASHKSIWRVHPGLPA